MLKNLFCADRGLVQEREVVVSGDKRNEKMIEMIAPSVIDGRYEKDIVNLKNHIGEVKFVPGLKIDVSLQELLSIAPRKRERSDAYVGLINYLESEFGIELKIKTKKKKKVK